MAKKLTYEEVKEYIESQGYKLLSKEYVNNNTKLILKDVDGYLYVTTWGNFQKGYKPNKFSKYNPYTIQNIKLWMKTNAKGYELLSTEYKSAGKDKLLFKCPKGHKFEMYWYSFKHGQRCPVCACKQATLETCISSTDPWMVKYFKNKNDIYTHKSQSHDKIPVVCPYCGKEKQMVISSIYRYKGICCSCGDGVSYPNKFVYNAMIQIFKIDNVFTEQKFKWSDNKIYDILIKTQNEDILIENHGEQHYKQTKRKGARTLKEEQNNDQYKKELAEQNGFTYIELDCRKSELEWIKQSILNSELNNLFDLSKIDWLKCEEFALSNRVKEICDYWKVHNDINNEGLTTTNIGEIFNLSNKTVRIYLNKGTKLGWCDYDAKAEMIKSNRKNGEFNSKVLGKSVEVFKNEESLGVFSSCTELEKQSEEIFGVKLFQGAISKVCRGEKPQYKGLTFRYVTQN